MSSYDCPNYSVCKNYLNIIDDENIESNVTQDNKTIIGCCKVKKNCRECVTLQDFLKKSRNNSLARMRVAMDKARSASIFLQSKFIFTLLFSLRSFRPPELIDNGIHNGNPLSVNCK